MQTVSLDVPVRIRCLRCLRSPLRPGAILVFVRLLLLRAVKAERNKTNGASPFVIRHKQD